MNGTDVGTVAQNFITYFGGAAGPTSWPRARGRLQADNIDTDGQARRCHVTSRLPLDVAMQLDDPITKRSDPRQTALWSPATFTAPRAA